MHFVDILYDYRVTMEFTPTGIHFPFFGNPVSLHFCMVFLHIVVEVMQINEQTNEQAIIYYDVFVVQDDR